MYGEVGQRPQSEIDEILAAGLWKDERLLESPQAARVAVGGREVLNFCANNYLGLANDPRLIQAAQEGLVLLGNYRVSVGGRSLGAPVRREVAGGPPHVHVMPKRSQPLISRWPVPPDPTGVFGAVQPRGPCVQ